jgi:hypothetical protein
LTQTQVTFVTLACDGQGCDKSVTFEPTQEGQQAALKAHPWLTAHREITTTDGRKFVYCSDECEIKNAGAGVHNKQEKSLIDSGNSAKVALAAQAAAHNRKATEALKQGSGVTL